MCSLVMSPGEDSENKGFEGFGFGKGFKGVTGFRGLRLRALGSRVYGLGTRRTRVWGSGFS